MAAGQPLTDADRWPWIERIAAEIGGDPGSRRERRIRVFGAEGRHRRRMQHAGDVRIVYMKGDRDTIGARLAAR